MGLFSFMKRRRLFIIFLGCLAAAILVFTLWPSEREPEYKGITLTKYLDRAAGSPNEELTEAIKHIGTNALPYLLRAVDYHPPRWKFALGWKILKLPWTKLNGRLALWLHFAAILKILTPVGFAHSTAAVNTLFIFWSNSNQIG